MRHEADSRTSPHVGELAISWTLVSRLQEKVRRGHAGGTFPQPFLQVIFALRHLMEMGAMSINEPKPRRSLFKFISPRSVFVFTIQ